MAGYGAWLHDTGERLFKFVMTNIPPLTEYNKALIKYREQRERMDRKQSKVSESRSFHLKQLELCYSKHREGKEKQILFCSSSLVEG